MRPAFLVESRDDGSQPSVKVYPIFDDEFDEQRAYNLVSYYEVGSLGD